MKKQKIKFYSTLLLVGALLFVQAVEAQTTYYVSPTGSDTNNGLSTNTAWKTLSHACGQVPAGNHSIQLAAGTYQETAQSLPKAGVKIVGAGRAGANKTTIKAPTSWDYSSSGCMGDALGDPKGVGYIIDASNQSNVSISNIEFVNEPADKANGAIYAKFGSNLTIDNVGVISFRFAGVFIRERDRSAVVNSYFFSSGANVLCDASNMGNLTTHYITNTEIHHNEFGGRGYGYRGRSQENVKIYGNVFNMANDGSSQFDIEIAHELEYGVDIFSNEFHGTVSVPRMGDQANPNSKGYSYTIRIHDNTSYASYAIEGSRNHLEVDHNMFYSNENFDGRIFTDYGVNTNGPVWIHHNVAESVDLGFIYKRGSASNFYVYNNTVYSNVTNKPENTLLRFFDVYTATGNNWVVRNNIFVNQSNGNWVLLGSDGQISNMAMDNNVYQGDFSEIPDNNFNSAPGLKLSGAKPYPFYDAASDASFVVNKGVEVNPGYPGISSYSGSKPDIGASEFSQPGGNNPVANPGFEANNGNTQAAQGWNESGDVAVSYVDNISPHGGLYKGNHWQSTAWSQASTYQLRTGLTNGDYLLKAYVTSNAAIGTMVAKGYNASGEAKSVAIPVSGWTQVSLKVKVENGQCEIGFYSSNGSANNFIAFDDVEFIQLITPPPPPGPQPLALSNPGFEVNVGQQPNKWDEWTNTNSADASYVEASDAHSGSNKLIHSKASAYRVYTSQQLRGTNGVYTVKAWVKSSGGQNSANMVLKSYGGGNLTIKIPASATYTQISATVIVTTGRLEVGFWSDANANNWLHVDDVELIRSNIPETGLVTNPGFEADNASTQTPQGWSEWASTANQTEVSYAESAGGGAGSPHTGTYRGSHWNASAWQEVRTYQTKSGLTNGSYRFSAWVKSNAAIGSIYTSNYGGAVLTTPIPVTSSWTRVSIDVNVTNGQCEFGFKSVNDSTNGSNWVAFDDAEFAPMAPNVVTNPSFEADNASTQTPQGWSEWAATSGQTLVSYVESAGGGAGSPNTGTYRGIHWSGSAWQEVRTYQIKTGLANGNYRLSAWVKSNAAIGSIYASNYGGVVLTTAIPVTSSWTRVSMDVNVTNGQCEFGFKSANDLTNGNNWVAFDDVEFAPAAPNLGTNPSFEADNAFTQTPQGWSEWAATGNQTEVSYVESSGGVAGSAIDGTYRGVHWSGSAWDEVRTYQLKTGLANGSYRFSVWVKSNAAIGSIYVSNYGGELIATPIPITYDWLKVSMDVNVTNGQCEFGFFSNSSGNQFIAFDDVELTQSSTPKTDLITNPGFEADNAATQTPQSWIEWTDNNSADASFTEANPRTGSFNLAHWKTSAYRVYTYQTITGLTNGSYVVKAWVKSSGGQNSSTMDIKQYGGNTFSTNIPATNTYTQISATVDVTTGRIEVGFWSDANANNWINVDDVEVTASTTTPVPNPNPGFEADNAATQTPQSWAEWTDNNGADASFTEAKPRTGSFNLAHWKTSAYRVYTYQIVTGLTNGSYTVKAWVKSSGGQNASSMVFKQYGGSDVSTTIPATNTYTQISATVNVTTGKIEVGFWSDANANNWINVDDVEFMRSTNAGARISYSEAVEEPTGSLFTSVYPNPASQVVKVSIGAKTHEEGTLTVTDLNGRILQTLNRTLTKGINEVEMDVHNLKAGVYFITVRIGHRNEVVRLVVLN
jgi:hypothetical protein